MDSSLLSDFSRENNENFRYLLFQLYSFLKSCLFALDPEVAHSLAKQGLFWAPKSIFKKITRVEDDCLKTQMGKTSLANPVGLAAGFDKNGDMTAGLSALGFGYLELGSVTAFPSPGNPKPRIFRLPRDKSLINRMGLPNMGADAFAKKMSAIKVDIPYGVNIAKTPAHLVKMPKPLNGIDDYLKTLDATQNLGAYFVLNLSCPNTEDGATFEDPASFSELITEIKSARKKHATPKPLLIKLSPDLEKKRLTRLIEMAEKTDIDGYVLTNTSRSRDQLKTAEIELKKIGPGGLSGAALTEAANQQLKTVYDLVGKRKTLIGVGGILSFEDLLAKISCGASLFQIYTGLIYHGPLFVRDLNKKLAVYCREHGVKNYRELIGEKI